MSTAKIDDKAMRSLACGVFLLTARRDGRDNGCIVNTALQATSTPGGLIVISNKTSLTHDMIADTGRFAVSVLAESAPYALFERFGMRSGRDVDKFADDDGFMRTDGGLYVLTRDACAMFEVSVKERVDMGTHTLFYGDVTESARLGDGKPMTYAYYHEHVRAQKPKAEQPKKGWVCSVCGYVYEGDELPADFVCPWCGHGASDFERMK